MPLQGQRFPSYDHVQALLQGLLRLPCHIEQEDRAMMANFEVA
jgi:hypothetical protein